MLQEQVESIWVFDFFPFSESLVFCGAAGIFSFYG